MPTMEAVESPLPLGSGAAMGDEVGGRYSRLWVLGNALAGVERKGNFVMVLEWERLTR